MADLIESEFPSLSSRTIQSEKVIDIPSDERKQQTDSAENIRKLHETQLRICRGIAKEKGVDIEYTRTKSNGISVIITGQPAKVSDAKRNIISAFHNHESIKLHVPRAYHGYLIGRKGGRLRDIEVSTFTRINIPSQGSPEPDIITISGPKQFITDAERLIKDEVKKQVEQGYERIDIPKIYRSFVCGANQSIIDDIRTRTDTKINVPPLGIPRDTFTITGKKENVERSLNELKKLLNDAENSTTMTVSIPRTQHRFIFGPRGSGIADIRAKTGVSVELPFDVDCEQILLRGRAESFGQTLTMIYSKANSSVSETVPAPNRLHKLLIGKGGSALNELREGYDRVRIEFGQNKDSILVEGPPEEVAIVVGRLNQRIGELEQTVAFDKLKVDPKFFSHIVGKQGANILRLRDNKIRINLPSEQGGGSKAVASDEITIEGDPNGVAKAKEEIKKMVERLENEKHKDLIIEPEMQRLLIAGRNGAPPPIRAIYDSFPKVTISWPTTSSGSQSSDHHDSNPSQSVVQLRGDRQQVDACGDRLTKLIKTVAEENYRQEIRIFKEFRPHVLGRNSAKMKKLLDDTKTRIQYPNPSDGSDVFTVIGREENVRQAIKQIEDMQKKLANVKELIVTIPSVLTTKLVGDQVPSLRSIREQCPEVHIRFLHPTPFKQSANNQVEVMILGPTEALEKAKQLIDQLNAKVAQLCAEEIVCTEPRFHGILIGRNGATISRFRERHNVELMFPDRNEKDAKAAREIRIIGPKEAVRLAKQDLETEIKSLEDEVDQTVNIEPALVKDFNQYRRTFPDPVFESIRLIAPRFSPTADVLKIKLIGRKASVDAALQSLNSILADLRQQVTKEYPISDVHHFTALERARSQFRDIEQQYRVYITLLRTPASSSDANKNDGVGQNNEDTDAQRSVSKLGTLVLTGPLDRIEQLYEVDIKALLPVEEQFALPQEFHRSLLFVPNNTANNSSNNDRTSRRNQPVGKLNTGAKHTDDASSTTTQSAATVCKVIELQRRHNVHIQIPPQNQPDADYVHLRGLPSRLAKVKEELSEWVKHCDELKQDKLARAFELTFSIPSRFASDLLAMRVQLTKDTSVGLRIVDSVAPSNLPNGHYLNGESQQEEAVQNGSIDQDSSSPPTTEETVNGESGDQDGSTASSKPEKLSLVTLRGYQHQAEAVKTEIEKAVTRLEAQVTESVHIPIEVHSQLIGTKGYAIQRVMQEFKVRIDFPSRQTRANKDDDQRNIVYVTGDESNVDDACDFLVNKANELVQRHSMEKPSRSFQQPIFSG